MFMLAAEPQRLKGDDPMPAEDSHGFIEGVCSPEIGLESDFRTLLEVQNLDISCVYKIVGAGTIHAYVWVTSMSLGFVTTR